MLVMSLHANDDVTSCKSRKLVYDIFSSRNHSNMDPTRQNPNQLNNFINRVNIITTLKLLCTRLANDYRKDILFTRVITEQSEYLVQLAGVIC